jgi:hypothetical protein
MKPAVDDVTRKRLQHNEAVFRSVNEEIDGRAAPGPVLAYVCECADIACNEAVSLTHAAYRAVRTGSLRFFVVPGHERAELERVVERHDDYLVVEKFSPSLPNSELSST